jgi:uncharacterized protein (TIGR03663 family)
VPTDRRRSKAKASRAAPRPEAQKALQTRRRFWPLTAWQWAGATTLAAAAALRLYDLSAKVLHHDEGVNGMFMTNLFRTGYYHYDPSNFHGPTLYYFGWITTTINSFFYGKEGLSTFAIRLVTALFGLGIIWLILELRRELGASGALAAAVLMAVSPGFVFFSRYFIHEVLFAFFTLAVVVAGLRFQQTKQPRYLMLASASAALLGATKETWVITIAVWLIALPCTSAYFYLRKRFLQAPAPLATSARMKAPADQTAEPASWSRKKLYITAGLVFVVVWVLFYSSFFTNFPQGVYDSVRTFGYWFKTSGSANLYGPTKYFEWIGLTEISTFVLGFAGIILAFILGRSRFAVLTAFWSIGILAAYCLVPYKTPWNALGFLLPFILMAGYGLAQLHRWLGGWIFLLVVPAVTWSLVQAVDISFNRYDDESAGYSYAHTKRDFLNLVNEIDSIAAGNPAGKEIGITIMSPEHWPLPWYLRDYPRAGYYGKVIPTEEPIIVAHENQRADVERLLGDKYRLFSSHDLRPGNRLYLYLRRDVQP